MITPAIPGLDDLVLIGNGGFADVYRARQPRFDRVVAVKVLRTPMRDEHVQAQFQRECSAAGRLTGHPNIVTVFQSGFLTNDGRPYIVMEWMEGGSLEDRLRLGPLPAAEVLRTGVKLCGALQTAHEAGVMHRDVKPANILVSAFGEPALADFGISSISSGTGMTSKLDALSPLYAAPEIIEGAPASASADVYALASSLYALLAGGPAFAGPEGEPMMTLVVRVLGEDVPPIVRSEVPRPVTDVVAAAMAKTPRDRPGSAAEFGEMLRRVQVETGQAPTEMAIRTPVQPGSDTGAVPGQGPPYATPNPAVTPAPGLHPGTLTPPGAAAAGVPSLLGATPAPAAYDTPPGTPRHVAGATVARPLPPAEEQAPAPEGPSTARRILVGAAAGALVAIFIIGGLFFARARGGPTTTTTTPPTSGPTTSTPPEKPTITKVEDKGSAVHLEWSDTVTTQATHVVRHSPATNDGALVPQPPGSTSAEVAGLDPTTGYCFWVGAVAGAKDTRWSDPSCIRGATVTKN